MQSNPEIHYFLEAEKFEKVQRRRSCKSSGFKTIRYALKSAGPSLKMLSNITFVDNIKESQIVTFGTSAGNTHRDNFIPTTS